MLFRGEHETSYRYSRPVFLEPHVVRLTPLDAAAQRLAVFELEVSPPPAGRCDILDASGNPATRLWFDGLHQTLTVHTWFEARTFRANPFDYLLDPAAARLPRRLSEAEKRPLGRIWRPGAVRPAGGFARSLRRPPGGFPWSFSAV